jgi:hypothetical protein
MTKEMTVSEELAARRSIGAQLANICYNVAQYRNTPDQVRKAMEECRKKWDAIPKSNMEMPTQEAIAAHLRTVMSGISEDGYCAGWLIDWEHSLWECAFLGQEDRDFGGAPVSPWALEQLRTLAKASDSWWVWDANLNTEVRISFAQACALFGKPVMELLGQAPVANNLVCMCPTPGEYVLPVDYCPVHPPRPNTR